MIGQSEQPSIVFSRAFDPSWDGPSLTLLALHGEFEALAVTVASLRLLQ
jgi:hypothetical protein